MRDISIDRWRLSDGWVDVLLHHRWIPWKPWTSCFQVNEHGKPPMILHRRFWTSAAALEHTKRTNHEMWKEYGRG
jgi:hypothetical protein